ncbi:uncharacterized protein LOC136034439 [Artemia franciscana]|uniref:uncharacterized protein LOC136034439 n=1 Tax=Artemia franciscana TaxID=6661 RepID=UPI0032DBCC95
MQFPHHGIYLKRNTFWNNINISWTCLKFLTWRNSSQLLRVLSLKKKLMMLYQVKMKSPSTFQTNFCLRNVKIFLVLLYPAFQDHVNLNMKLRNPNPHVLTMKVEY